MNWITISLIVICAILALCIRALYRDNEKLRRRMYVGGRNERYTMVSNTDFPIKFYRLKRDYYDNWNGFKYDVGTVWVEYPSLGLLHNVHKATVRLATHRDQRVYYSPGSHFVERLFMDGAVKEVGLHDIKNLRPHFHKHFLEVLRYYGAT